MRAATPIGMLLVLLVSGCFQAPTGDSVRPLRVGTDGPLFFDTPAGNDSRGQDDLWVVFVTGTENTRLNGPGDDQTTECENEADFEIDPDAGRLTYDPDRVEMDLDNHSILVVTMFWADDFSADHRGVLCASLVQAELFNRTADTTLDLGHYGKARLRVFPQGILGIPGDYVLPLGKGARYEFVRQEATRTANYWVVGEWAVANLGAWPKSAIEPAA